MSTAINPQMKGRTRGNPPPLRVFGFPLRHDYIALQADKAVGPHPPGTSESERSRLEPGRICIIIMRMRGRCGKIWNPRRVRTAMADVDGETMLVLCLAQNTSREAMKVPERQTIDRLKESLEIDQDPRWYTPVYDCE